MTHDEQLTQAVKLELGGMILALVELRLTIADLTAQVAELKKDEPKP